MMSEKDKLEEDISITRALLETWTTRSSENICKEKNDKLDVQIARLIKEKEDNITLLKKAPVEVEKLTKKLHKQRGDLALIPFKRELDTLHKLGVKLNDIRNSGSK